MKCLVARKCCKNNFGKILVLCTEFWEIIKLCCSGITHETPKNVAPQDGWRAISSSYCSPLLSQPEHPGAAGEKSVCSSAHFVLLGHHGQSWSSAVHSLLLIRAPPAPWVVMHLKGLFARGRSHPLCWNNTHHFTWLLYLPSTAVVLAFLWERRQKSDNNSLRFPKKANGKPW